MRMRPDSSCFAGQEITSQTSPSLSLREPSMGLTSSPTSIAAYTCDSLVTLKSPWFSTRKAVPWLPAKVTQPSAPSDKAFAWTRFTFIVSSNSGPLMSSRASFNFSCRTVSSPATASSLVIGVSLTTLKMTRMTRENTSFVMCLLPASTRFAKRLFRASGVRSTFSTVTGLGAASAGASPSATSATAASSSSFRSLSAEAKKARNSFSSILLSPFLSNLPKRSSVPRLFTLACCWATFTAKTRTLSISAARFLAAVLRKRMQRLVTRLRRRSTRPIRKSKTLASLARSSLRSSLCLASTCSGMAAIFVRTAATAFLPTSTSFSIASACLSMSGTAMAFALAARGATACSAFSTSFSAPTTDPSTALIFSKSFDRRPARTFSFSTRAALLLLSRCSSRAMPTEDFIRWNLSRTTPFCSLSTAHFQTLSKMSSVTANLSSF
mmetsp:Transcript_75734/g.136601  ORF Transcript_75734/g.136601 Transcript_75734/m.136601 type:complete len:439 (+) Transcript_75734:246-1562(+)